MLTLIHKECGGPALDESPVGEVCAIPIDRFPFACFSCLEEIDRRIGSQALRRIGHLTSRGSAQLHPAGCATG